MTFTAKILLLGSGELGREFTISAKRLGAELIACDSYAGAPAMQMADGFEVFPMLDGAQLRSAVERHQPDFVVPEIEAIRTEELLALEKEGWNIVPSARAAAMTMNRDSIRSLAADELGLRTSRFRFAESLDQVVAAARHTGFPCVIKPVMSSSGKGQLTVESEAGLEPAWRHAVANMRGDRARVIVEEFVDFDQEITLLTISSRNGVSFCPPIGHRQEHGDYRESWQPASTPARALAEAQDMARKVVEHLGGHGLFGVEFFICGEQAIFSELSPRPHDTGMVTSLSQNLSQFDLHARALLGLPIDPIHLRGPSASAVILADRDSEIFQFTGLDEALSVGTEKDEVDVRLFSKPVTRPGRRMGVALARSASVDQARALAMQAAGKVRIAYSSKAGSTGEPSEETPDSIS